jgi:Ca-activated chloride channel family protein
MFGRVYPPVCLAIFLAFIFPLTLTAQISIDDVHVAARSHGITLATPGTIARIPNGIQLIHSNVDLVTVPVTITDALNRPVVGLDQDNFQLFENKKPQEIRNFSTDDAPVSIGIILDVSGSMANKLARAREAVQQFCDASNPQDEFFMITFSDAPNLTADFTGSAEELQNRLLTVRAHGRTALLDAIHLGLRKMGQARYARRALLIISDGGDNRSRFSEGDVKAAAKEADVLIYAVGIFDNYFNTEEETLGPELLASVTRLTGGQTFTLRNIGELPALTRIIGNQLRHQYLLAYRPQFMPKDGKWHKISVKLRLPKTWNGFLRVNARPGYYAQDQ